MRRAYLQAALVLAAAPLVAGSIVWQGARPARAAASGSWSTYAHDSSRAGVDPDQPAFDTVTAAWPALALDGQVFAQPLIVGSQVLVATENNSIYSFDITTGAQLWAQTQLAPPVTSGLTCGTNLAGITSTPVG